LVAELWMGSGGERERGRKGARAGGSGRQDSWRALLRGGRA